MTTTVITSGKSRSQITIILPCLPEHCGGMERDIYMSFIRAYREGPSRRMEVRILTAIHRAADQTDNSDAYVTRVLADMGEGVGSTVVEIDLAEVAKARAQIPAWRHDPTYALPARNFSGRAAE